MIFIKYMFIQAKLLVYMLKSHLSRKNEKNQLIDRKFIVNIKIIEF